MGIFYEAWAPGYGSPYQIDTNDDEQGGGELVEDGLELRFHDCPEISLDGIRLAFTDGVRRVDGWLYHHDELTGEISHAVVGTYGVGAVLFDGGARAEFAHVAVERVVVWGNGRTDPLPVARGGYAWSVASQPKRDPAAPMIGLQNMMRDHEKVIAELLCDQIWTVVADGTLNGMRTRDRPVVGFIKTQHRRMLAPEDHRRVAELEARHRTSVFRLGKDRFSCYFRLQPPGATDGPWYAIIRLEVPADGGLEAAVVALDQAAGLLPRYSGVAWRDPRAPQNLQPIGALEDHLRRLLGDQTLANRAARDAIAVLQRQQQSATAMAELAA